MLPFTAVSACKPPCLRFAMAVTGHHARLGTRLRARLCRGLHFRRLSFMSCKAQPGQIRTCTSTHTALMKDEWRKSVHQDRGGGLGVVTPGADEDLTLELFRRGAHGIVSREVEPELLVQCLRKVVAGETWLDSQGVRWVMEAYRNQNNRPTGSRPKVQLTPKEMLIVSCVTQGMKNKEIALRVGTTEQVVKNYLRKVYDKLGVADRLELALYCLNHHVVDNTKVPPLPVSAANGNAAKAASAGASASGAPSTTALVSAVSADSPEKLS